MTKCRKCPLCGKQFLFDGSHFDCPHCQAERRALAKREAQFAAYDKFMANEERRREREEARQRAIPYALAI